MNKYKVDQTKFLIELGKAEEINHIVVFMTGEQAFPEGYAATVHFLWWVYRSHSVTRSTVNNGQGIEILLSLYYKLKGLPLKTLIGSFSE